MVMRRVVVLHYLIYSSLTKNLCRYHHLSNIVGMPVNCDKIRDQLTAKLSDDANIHLWVGAWRRGVSWNHAKIIVSSPKWNPALLYYFDRFISAHGFCLDSYY